MRSSSPLVVWTALALAVGAAGAQETTPRDDLKVKVTLDAAEQSGSASAEIRIQASRRKVWSIITSCQEAVLLVPGLVGCRVLESSPDGSWQRIRHVLSYSWFIPKLTYDLRATYDAPEQLSMVRTSGDLKELKVTWTLQADGDATIAHYTVDLVPGFWVPRWLVRAALRHDMPKMLRTVRARAEAISGT